MIHSRGAQYEIAVPALSTGMLYTREELDWMEAEWAFHLHGRSAFMSREDFLQLQVWAGEGVPADAIVNAMETYFTRRAKRAKARSFVALDHLAKDGRLSPWQKHLGLAHAPGFPGG